MFSELTKAQKEAMLSEEQAKFASFAQMGLKLDMSRGKPSKEQLDLSMGLLDALNSETNLIKKVDYRNYGIVDGIPELKAIFCDMLNIADNQIIIGGNSSLNMMYDSVQRAMQFGVGGEAPLNKQGEIKWLCPVPGYDRHFGVTEAFGITMINVPMTDEGVDVEVVKELVKDKSVKGMWCVPKYSNPQGIVYSDRVVKELASLKPAAKDFRIYWDNAYFVHSLTNDGDDLTDILEESKKAGNPDIAYVFGSTSKISFAGAGVAFMASSEANIAEAKKRISVQTIGPDKLNQYAHALYFKDAHGIAVQMDKHRAILAPKFNKVLEILERELSGIAKWNKPRGGYFISVDLPNGTAQKTVELANELGVKFTPAGSTYPYKKDPNDSNLRIAPSLPPIDELEKATEVFCCCAKIAYLTK